MFLSVLDVLEEDTSNEKLHHIFGIEIRQK